jgi:hypothetical protein
VYGPEEYGDRNTSPEVVNVMANDIFSYLGNVNVGIALKFVALMALFIFYILKSITTFFQGKKSY